MLEYFQLALLWLGRQVWYALPLITTVVAMIVFMAPADFLGRAFPPPDIALVAVFFWAIYGPSFLPPWAVFLLGLAQDFATGAPLGFWPVIYLSAYAFTMSQRVFFIGRSGWGVVFGFAVVAILTAAVAWVLGSIVFARWLPAGQIFLQALISVLLYLPASKVFGWMRRWLSNAREAI